MLGTRIVSKINSNGNAKRHALHRVAVATIGVVLGIATLAPAQTTGPNAPAPAAGVPAQAAAGAPAGFDDRGVSRTVIEDFPVDEVQAVPMAAAGAVQARWMYYNKRDDLWRTVDRLHEDFEYSPDYQSALKEEKDAFKSYDEARKRIIQKLSSDSQYVAMISLRDRLRDQIIKSHPGPKASPEEMEHLVAQASVKLGYSSNATDMESAALAADEPFQQAKTRLIAAGERITTLKTSFARTIRRDPEFNAMRREMQEAQVARLTTDAFLVYAIDARDIALDYSAYLHRWDDYKYLGQRYSRYGYGYGYRYPTAGGYGYSYR